MGTEDLLCIAKYAPSKQSELIPSDKWLIPSPSSLNKPPISEFDLCT